MNQEDFKAKLSGLQIPNFRDKHNQQRDLFILNAWLCEGKDMTKIVSNDQSLETSSTNLDVHRSTVSRSIQRLCEYFEVKDKAQLVSLFLKYAPEFVHRIRFDQFKISEQQYLLDRIEKKKLYDESLNNIEVDNEKNKVTPQSPENTSSDIREIVDEEMGGADGEPVGNISPANETTDKFGKRKPVTNISPATKTIIDDRLSNGFVGREFVFEAFQKFISEHSHGYFTIVAEPGMGKSTIAAQYVRVRSVDVDCVCFFINYRGDNTEEACIIDICRQLRELYGLEDDLQGVSSSKKIGITLANYLQEISDYKLKNRKLVIVIDALDELEKSNSSSNICFLPHVLPSNIYFLLTRRPFEVSEERLDISPSCQKQNFQMWKDKYVDNNKSDIKEYIENQFKSGRFAENLKKWIDRKNIPQPTFVETLTDRSNGNFMYIRYLIPAIADANGIYQDASLSELPSNLKGHYRNHLDRMYRIQTSVSVTETDKKRIIAVFLQSRKVEVSISYIANLLELAIDGVVKPIIIHFVPFFDPRYLDPKEVGYIKLYRDVDQRYQFYRKDFVDFLREEEIEEEIQSYVNRKIEDQNINVFDLESIFGLSR
ncbi:MAG: hypothetical protein ACK5QS_04250 [Pseudanabaenaceae cyanobacterium]